MHRRTKIVATVGPQRRENEINSTDELGPFLDGVVPHAQLLEKFIDAGVDIIRLNMSFASQQEPYGANEEAYLCWLNKHCKGKARNIAVIGDLPGPKIRLGRVFLEEDQPLKKSDIVNLSFGNEEPVAPGAMVQVNDRPFNDAIDNVEGEPDFSSYVNKLCKRGQHIDLSIGDGKVELRVESDCGENVVQCKVVSDGVILEDFQPKKGLTIKHATLVVSAFRDADQRALDFLLKHSGDMLAYVAVSFAQNKIDIIEVQHYMETHEIIEKKLAEQRRINPKTTARIVCPGIIAKIETRIAWNNIHEILDVADGVMVARGDLGEQIPAEEVPEIQKDLIQMCKSRGKVVITATQMLDSMEKKQTPTRAEATDVFNAILDGTDAVMLSGETSKGCHPIKAIETMDRIAVHAEQYYYMPSHRVPIELVLAESANIVKDVTSRLVREEIQTRKSSQVGPEQARAFYRWLADLYSEKIERSVKQRTTDRICAATCRLSEAPKHVRGESSLQGYDLEEWVPKLIVVPTTTGRTVFMIARFRPQACIIGAAHYERTYRKLLLSFGVCPVWIGAKHSDSEQIIHESFKVAIAAGLLKPGDDIISTSGTPLYVPGTTNMIQLLKVS